MAVVIANQLRKDIAGDPLFDGVSFKVERRDRVSLSGPNGAGKTTLLRMLAGELGVDGGKLVFSKGTRVALHDQRPPLARGLTLREYVLSGASDLIALEEELRELEGAMAAGSHDEATLARYAEAQAKLEHAGGYAWRERTAGVIRGLGFSETDLDRSLDTFSGGELTRASLARALAGDPDLLLLDEPTNHLDVESIEWLERELQSLDAAVILVAHDRWFLESVTNAVVELAGGRTLYFAGPWSAWRLEKAARAQAAEKTLGRLDVDIARLERFVERFRYKKSKAKQAQAKLTHIGRLETERSHSAGELENLTKSQRTLGFEFLKPARSGRTVVEAEGLVVSAGTKELLDSVSFALEREEHVALVGPNGSGKTTLLETILDRHAAAGRQRSARLRGRGGVLLAARDRVGRAGQRPRLRPAGDGAAAATGAVAARALPVLGLARAREACNRAVGGRAATACVGARGRIRRQLPPARRADEPSRPREPRGARSSARGLPRDRAARLARPCADRRGRSPDSGDRGPLAAHVRGRLGRADPAPGGARARRDASAAPKVTEDAAVKLLRSGRSRARSSSSRPTSSDRKKRSPSSSASWRMTGGTSSCWRRTARRATSSRRCSPAGKQLFERSGA